MSTALIEQITALIESGKATRSGLARAAGLHFNTLRQLGQPGWNPTAETLGRLESYLARNSNSVMATTEEIIEEARNGRMYILVDDEDRENEGDLIIPAQMATPDAINFMATHGRGLICLAMTRQRVDQLGLPLMAKKNESGYETAFTVSIEAREGVTTGISAADRARTINVAVDTSKGPNDIVSPGHIFPLAARDGGVLIRAGHTEAAVDVSRLAGLNPSGVICEIMRDDGTMARLDDLVEFAARHKMKIGTIRDLIAYRLQYDRMVERLHEERFSSVFGGEWTAITYRNKALGNEMVALVKGHVIPDQSTLVRMHQMNMFTDVFGERGNRRTILSKSMEMIGAEGKGVIVLVHKASVDYMSRAIQMRRKEGHLNEEEIRDYGAGAQILSDLGVHEMVLLTNSHHTVVGLDAYGLSIVGERAVPAED